MAGRSRWMMAATCWAAVGVFRPGNAAALQGWGQRCRGTATVSANDWEEIAKYANAASSAELALGIEGGLSWDVWSKEWLQIGMQVAADLGNNLADCPEGAITALLHSLPALEKMEGDSSTAEVVKLLYHLISTRPLAFVTSGASKFQQQWLLAVGSLLRFVYQKWVQIPRDFDPANVAAAKNRQEEELLPAMPQLQLHHAFIFKHTVEDFQTSGVYDLQMSENSVLFSEAFSLVAFCRLHEVERVIESGVYKGVSAEIWSLLVKEVVGIDALILPEAKARLAPRPNVRLEAGDGRMLVPKMLKDSPTKKTAVFIDGPKGELAIRMATSLRGLPGVAFVAIHDMGLYRNELTKLGAFFFSDESWFQAAYRHLDAPFHARPELPAGGTMAFLT